MEWSLAGRLRWVRVQLEITLQQLSERTGLSASYLSQLEHGVRTNPTKHTVDLLAGALGVRSAFLFGEVSPPEHHARAEAQFAREESTLGQRFRAHWHALSDLRRLEYRFAAPERRFCLVVSFLLESMPQQFTPVELAWQLGMSLAQFRDITKAGQEASHTFLTQLSRIAGVPMSFLTHGAFDPEPGPPVPQGEEIRYIQAIRLALEHNVSPERLVALIRADLQG